MGSLQSGHRRSPECCTRLVTSGTLLTWCLSCRLQQGDAEDLQALLYKELERTPPHGPQFSQAIAALMRQEDLWADWKANGAKSFERPEAHLESHVPPPKRRRINRQDAVNLGTRELTRCEHHPLHCPFVLFACQNSPR